MGNRRLGARLATGRTMFGHMLPLALVALLLLGVLGVPTLALAQTSAPPELREAKSAALIDSAGNVLFALNPDMELPPASITKVMTVMVALDSGHDLNDVVTLVAPDLGDNSQMADYGEGDRVPFGELLRVMLVYSANDAAYNVAVTTAGSEAAFVERMNQKAAQIGMTHTHFENSHGLESDHHYSSAMDLAIMGRYAIEHYPLIAQTAMAHEVWTTTHGYQARYVATNKMLDTYPGMRGLKTGAVVDNYTFLGASGRAGVQLYSAVLGCSTFTGRFDDTASLMDWGYANYRDHALTHPEWAVRLNPYAFDFARKVVVAPREVVVASVWDEPTGIAGSSALGGQNELLAANAICGYGDWSQSGRYVASSLYATRPVPVSASAWPVFSEPLFQDAASMGL